VCLFVCLFVGPPFYSQRAVFASSLSVFFIYICSGAWFFPDIGGKCAIMLVCLFARAYVRRKTRTTNPWWWWRRRRRNSKSGNVTKRFLRSTTPPHQRERGLPWDHRAGICSAPPRRLCFHQRLYVCLLAGLRKKTDPPIFTKLCGNVAHGHGKSNRYILVVIRITLG